jgi:hypothetical protein
LGFTARDCPDIRWNPSDLYGSDLIYCVGKLLVSMNTKTSHQKFFYGSTSPITNMEVFHSGEMVVTTSNDKVPTIKIWDY